MKNNNIYLLVEWYGGIQRVISLLDELTEEYDLSFSSFRMLDQIYHNEMLTPGQLADFESTSRPAVSRKLNLLQGKGYIRKFRDDPYDQRIVKLSITVEGETAYLNICKTLNEKINNILFEFKKVNKTINSFELSK